MHAGAETALQAWRRVVEKSGIGNFASLRRCFNSVDVVGEYHVFNVKGNDIRIVCGISFAGQVCFVKHVLTHAEYDRGKWK